MKSKKLGSILIAIIIVPAIALSASAAGWLSYPTTNTLLGTDTFLVGRESTKTNYQFSWTELLADTFENTRSLTNGFVSQAEVNSSSNALHGILIAATNDVLTTGTTRITQGTNSAVAYAQAATNGLRSNLIGVINTTGNAILDQLVETSLVLKSTNVGTDLQLFYKLGNSTNADGMLEGFFAGPPESSGGGNAVTNGITYLTSELTSTNANTNTLLTVVIPTNHTAKIKGEWLAAGATNSASWEKSFTFRNASGVISLVASNQITESGIANHTTNWNARISVSGTTNLLVRAIGSAEPINWTWAGTAIVASNDVAGSSGPTLIASDNFDSYADGAGLGSQANWSALVGTVFVDKPASDGKVYASGSTSVAYYDATTFSANQMSKATVDMLSSSGSFAFMLIAVRCQSGAETGYYFQTDGANWYLFSRVAGDQQPLAIGTQSIVVTDTISLEASGAGSSTRLTVKLNDSPLSGATDVDPGSGKYIDGGYPGIGGVGGSQGSALDDWEGWDL